MPVILEDLESDGTTSKADFSDLCANSMNQDANSFSRQASSKATTPPSPFPPHDPDISTSGLAKPSEIDVEMEMIKAENSRSRIKRKASKTQRRNQSGCQIP